MKKLQQPSKGKAGRGKLPTKRTINLAAVSEDKIDLKIAIPAVILILLAAALLGKFAVVDRLQAMADAESEAAELRSQVDMLYAEIAQYESLEQDYAHYTYSGMTDEELALTDRAEVIDMLQRTLRPQDSAGAWSISNNQLTIEVVGNSLQQINELARLLEADPMVDFCTVTNAVMTETELKEDILMTGLLGDDAVPEEAPEGESAEAPEGEEPYTDEEADEEPGSEPEADIEEDAETEVEQEAETEEDAEAEEEPILPQTIQSVKANVIVFLQNPTEEDSQ